MFPELPKEACGAIWLASQTARWFCCTAPSPQELHIKSEVLGYGSEGTVVRATLDGRPVAAKKIAINHVSLQNREASSLFWKTYGCLTAAFGYPMVRLPDEIDIHRRLTEENSASEKTGILPLLAIFRTSYYFLAVLPVFDFDLRSAMPEIIRLAKSTTEADQQLHKKIVFGFLSSMVLALNAFQDANIVHRDLKPENIAFAAAFSEKNASLEWHAFDYGLASSEQIEITEASFKGSPEYAAPESLAEKIGL